MESPVPFCAFCLRANPPNVEFYKHVVNSTIELRHSFQSMLGYDFQLVNFSICKPCWKLMQLVQDFRLRCFKANGLMKRIDQGLTSEDDWFSVKNLAILESVRMMIKDQVQQIGKVSVSGGEELMRTGGATDREGELVSTVEISEIKIESVVSLNPEAAKGDEKGDKQNEKQQIRHECSKCGRTFQLKRSLKNHSVKCTGKIKCEICFAVFTQHYLFETHMNKHEGKTPFVCRKNCTRGFVSGPVRTKHEAKCAEDERQCTLCEEKLYTNERLQEHYKLVHPMEKKFRCKMCDGKFNRLNDLKFHVQLKHKDNAPKFPCPICGKQFSVRYNLKPHIEQVHGGERNFQCEICNKRVTNRSCLRVHVARFHPEAASDYARTLLARKQARMRAISQRNALRKLTASKNEEADSSKSHQPTLHEFEGFHEI